MCRRVAFASSSDFTAWSSPAKMFVWPLGLIPAIADWMSWRPPSGAVWMTQCAESSNATTPSSSWALRAEAARRIASLPMSTLRTPPIPDPPPAPPLKLLQ